MKDGRSLGEKYRWIKYWYFTRRWANRGYWLARRVPRRLRYWVFVNVISEVTCYPQFDHRIVPDITATEVLEAYHTKLKRR